MKRNQIDEIYTQEIQNKSTMKVAVNIQIYWLANYGKTTGRQHYI